MRDITVIRLLSVETLAAGATKTSDVIDLGSSAAEGYFSFQYKITGGTTGTSIYAAYKVSNDGANFTESSDGYRIATAAGVALFNSTTGPGSGGQDLFAFTPPPCARMKIYVWNSGGTGCSVTATVAIA